MEKGIIEQIFPKIFSEIRKGLEIKNDKIIIDYLEKLNGVKEIKLEGSIQNFLDFLILESQKKLYYQKDLEASLKIFHKYMGKQFNTGKYILIDDEGKEKKQTYYTSYY